MLTTVLLGAVAGALVIKLVPTDRIGWDALARALGGVGLGGIAGLVAGVAVAVLWPARRLFTAAAVALALAVVCAAVVVVVPAARIPTPEPPPPFDPPFVIQMHPHLPAAEIQSMEAKTAGYPLQRLRVDAASRTVTFKRWGTAVPPCRIEATDAEMESLLERARAIAGSSEEACDSVPGRPGFYLSVQLEGDPSRVTHVTAACLSERPDVVSLLRRLESIGRDHSNAPGCSGPDGWLAP